MSKTEANAPASLGTMLGSGDDFQAKDKTYSVKPIALEHIEEFMADNLSIGSQLFNVANKESAKKVDKWMGGLAAKDGKIERVGYCFDLDGNPVDLQKAMADHWDIVDLKNFFKKLCDLSG